MSIADDIHRASSAVTAFRDDPLKSVANALDVLDCFLTDDELGVSEVARSLGVAKSSAHRMLSTLVSRGFVERNTTTGRYRLGLHLYELGQLSISRSRLRQAALPIMEDLRQRTGHTTHLGVADGADVVHLERLQCREGLYLLDAVLPRRFPTHCSATGKVLAAFDPAVAEARRRAGFPPITSNSVHTVAQWDATLAKVRCEGVAINRDEVQAGVMSVAAPIFDATGQLHAALSIVGPTEMMESSLPQLTRLLVEATRQLGRRVS
ncbi:MULTISPECIES: IclR family transcriptional regulator [Mycobacterium]|uniref:IclR family transcriptional regulator n=1 Tax=Mycobacterium TaxID=1763 RepID=UPI001E439D77|nr:MULTISPECIES: IclR family transcriptional regulator [Mycobacterium]